MSRHCDACGRQVGDTHFRRSGPRCQSGNHFWTIARCFRLAELTDAGLDDDQIAATLSREWGRPISPHALNITRWRHHLGGFRSSALSAEETGTMLGVSSDPVRRWIVNGWLPAGRGRRMGAGFAWRIDRTDLWAFVENPLYWHAWSTRRVTDPALRCHVAKVRGADPYVPVSEAVERLAGRGLFVSRATINHWARTGHLPSITTPVADLTTSSRSRRGLRLIPVVALDAVQPPRLGGGRKRVAA